MKIRKDFTKSDNAINKFFSQPNIGDVPDESIETEISEKHTNITNDTNVIKHTKHTNVSKHYDRRGKRDERMGLLMDKNLKGDLRLLVGATDSTSVNDLIVSVLVDYVEKPENKRLLDQLRGIMK